MDDKNAEVFLDFDLSPPVLEDPKEKARKWLQIARRTKIPQHIQICLNFMATPSKGILPEEIGTTTNELLELLGFDERFVIAGILGLFFIHTIPTCVFKNSFPELRRKWEKQNPEKLTTSAS